MPTPPPNVPIEGTSITLVSPEMNDESNNPLNEGINRDTVAKLSDLIARMRGQYTHDSPEHQVLFDCSIELYDMLIDLSTHFPDQLHGALRFLKTHLPVYWIDSIFIAKLVSKYKNKDNFLEIIIRNRDDHRLATEYFIKEMLPLLSSQSRNGLLSGEGTDRGVMTFVVAMFAKLPEAADQEEEDDENDKEILNDLFKQLTRLSPSQSAAICMQKLPVCGYNLLMRLLNEPFLCETLLTMAEQFTLSDKIKMLCQLNNDNENVLMVAVSEADEPEEIDKLLSWITHQQFNKYIIRRLMFGVSTFIGREKNILARIMREAPALLNSFLDFVEPLSIDDKALLLAHTDDRGNNILMMAYPHLHTRLDRLLGIIKRLRIDQIAPLLLHKNNEGKNVSLMLQSNKHPKWTQPVYQCIQEIILNQIYTRTLGMISSRSEPVEDYRMLSEQCRTYLTENNAVLLQEAFKQCIQYVLDAHKTRHLSASAFFPPVRPRKRIKETLDFFNVGDLLSKVTGGYCDSAIRLMEGEDAEMPVKRVRRGT